RRLRLHNLLSPLCVHTGNWSEMSNYFYHSGLFSKFPLLRSPTVRVIPRLKCLYISRRQYQPRGTGGDRRLHQSSQPVWVSEDRGSRIRDRGSRLIMLIDFPPWKSALNRSGTDRRVGIY